MPRKTFDASEGDFPDTVGAEDGEFLERLGEIARSHGYGIQRIEVATRPNRRDEIRWVDTEQSDD